MIVVSPSGAHLELVRKRWSFDGPLVFHRHMENVIYFSRLGGREVVVRLTEGGKRSAAQLHSELHWQLFLMERGASCSRPLPSEAGELVETVEAQGLRFHVCVFERAPGGPLKDTVSFTDEAMGAWGATLAEFHEMTRGYRRPSEVEARPQWDAFVSPETEGRLRARMRPRELRRYLETLEILEREPRTEDRYGLVHTDLHTGNFHWDGRKITAFDFDDCCHHWFAYDLTVPLFYLHFATAREGRSWDLAGLEAAYLDGYRRVRSLEPDWDSRFRLFFSYRLLVLYAWSAIRRDDPGLSEASRQWCRDYLEWVHGRDEI